MNEPLSEEIRETESIFKNISTKQKLSWAKQVEEMEVLIGDLKLFAEWVETIGRTDCETYKHELLANANLALRRIEFVNTRESEE